MDVDKWSLKVYIPRYNAQAGRFIIGAIKAFPEYNLGDLFYVDSEGQPVKSSNNLPDFREYARQKYPKELDEDLITMIEDLIERGRAKRHNDDGK